MALMDIIFLATGISVMAFAAYRGLSLYKILSSPKAWFSMGKRITKTWGILSIMILFFLIMYVAYFIIYTTGYLHVPLESITSLVFMAGSVFVYLVVDLDYTTYSKLNKRK